MTKDNKQSIALMRYGAIAPVIHGVPEEYPSLSAYFRELSQAGIAHPSGDNRHYAPGTIESWLLDYRKGGFDALIPKSRSDCGTSRKIDDDLQEQIRYLKSTYPRLSASAIFRQLQDNGSFRITAASDQVSSLSIRSDTRKLKGLSVSFRPDATQILYLSAFLALYLFSFSCLFSGIIQL